MHNKNYF